MLRACKGEGGGQRMFNVFGANSSYEMIYFVSLFRCQWEEIVILLLTIRTCLEGQRWERPSHDNHNSTEFRALGHEGLMLQLYPFRSA